MRPDKIGEALGVTDITRDEAKAWNIGTHGGSKQARETARKEKHRMRDEAKRRAAGARPHAQSLSRLQPWEAEGVCRRTWERRRARASEDGPPEGGVANSCATNKVSQIPAPQIPARPISGGVANSCATNIDNTRSALLSSQTTPNSGRGSVLPADGTSREESAFRPISRPCISELQPRRA